MLKGKKNREGRKKGKEEWREERKEKVLKGGRTGNTPHVIFTTNQFWESLIQWFFKV